MTPRAHLLLALSVALAACKTDPKPSPGGEGEGEDDTGTTDSGTTDTGDPDLLECDSLPDPPYTPERLRGFTQSEDFVFDADGHIISIDNSGNLVRHTYEGEKSVIVPRVGEVAGMAMMANGDIVLANVGRGSVDRITADGGVTQLATGIDYPNGITVDSYGYVYVSEHSRGRVRQIDPETGDFTILAEGLTFPNGLSFSPDESTLYVNSFGGGTIHAIERTGATFGETATIGHVDSGPEYDDPCDTMELGDECYLPMVGLGACTVDGCTPNPDEDACASLSAGDPCTTTRGGEPFESTCQDVEGTLVCPRIDAALVDQCADSALWDECDVPSGGWGYCESTWEGMLACLGYTELERDMRNACAEAELGDPCVVDNAAAPYAATCESGSIIGVSGLICAGGPWFAGMYGGLDGLDVDACGNVYVTEYITGLVYRVPPEGGVAEEILSLESQWIPNLHWGSGVGGWSKDLLYVMDRDDDSVHAVDVGIHGRPVVHLPE